MARKKQDCSSTVHDKDIQSKKNNFEGKIQYLSIDELEDFKNHPFKVEMNMELFELMQSIEKEGVLVPLLARPNPSSSGYELIAGHRRKVASKWAGLKVVPVMVVDLDDSQAVIAMVDSNLQREHIKPSEKAFAYRMRLEAMKQQGRRTDLTLSQFGTKLMDNPTLSVAKVIADYDESGEWKLQNVSGKMRADEVLARQVGESRNQISRYIRLTYLIPKILDWVDEGRIAFTVAVELSYLNEEEQYELYTVMDMEQCTPSLSQANRLKRLSQSEELDMDGIYLILEEEKPNQREQIRIRSDRLAPYFPEDYTDRQKIDIIERLVREWHQEQEKERKR